MKVCFVGSGSIGRRHIFNLRSICLNKNEPLEVHLLRSSTRELDRELQAAVDRQFFSTQELESFYDAVFICNPTFMHYASIRELSRFSRTFFVEKPVFDSVECELDGLELPRENRYYVACPLRYTGVLKYAEKVISKEMVISARAISSSYLPDWRPGVDYKQTYSAKKEEGGGVRIDLIHEWDYLVDLFGYPEEVFSFSGKYSDLDINSDDLAVYIGRYADKLVELHLDYIGRNSKRSLEIWTNADEYLFDIRNKCVYRNGELVQSFQEETNDMYVRELEYFLEVVKGEVNSSNDLEKALSVLKIAERAEWKKERYV